MDIEIGSNLYRNSDGTIDIEGMRQLEVAMRKTGGPPLVTFALFDGTGRMMAKVVDSNLTFNERRAYELSKSGAGVTLKHTETGTIVFSIELKNGDRVVFNRGTFHTIKGHVLEVTPTDYRLDKRRMSGGDTDAKGGAVQIG
jgi:transcription antitermination factor NusG